MSTNSNIDFDFYSVKKNYDETGCLDDVEEVNSYKYYNDKVNNIIMTKNAARPENDLAAEGYGHLRSAIEVTVEKDLLKDIIKRYRKGVAFPALLRIDGQKLDTYKAQLNVIYERCCVFIVAHSSPTELHTAPTIIELKDDFEEFKKLRKIFTN